MLARFGSFLYDRRSATLVVSGLTLVLAIATMALTAGRLVPSGFTDDGSESARVERQLAETFGRGQSSLVLLFDAGQPVDAGVRDQVDAALAPLAADPRVVQILTAWSTGDSTMVSADGASTYAVVLLTIDADAQVEQLDSLLALVQPGNALTVSASGFGPIGQEISHEVEEGILRAETIGVPLTVLMQLVVFGGLVAAGVPLLVGALAIVASLALIFALSLATGQSIFAANIISLLGLGLGVDYSLFMVARYREELQRRPVQEALSVMMGTVGKAILLSGITVIFGLAATQFFPLMAIRSMGQAGMLVVALSLVYALTFLPALLAILGHRINAIPLGLHTLRRRKPTTANGSESRFWGGVAQVVMRHPWRTLAPVLALMLLASLPFLRLNMTAGDEAVLPEGSPARVTTERIEHEFPAGQADAIPVVVSFNGDVLSPENLARLAAFVAAAAAIPGVEGTDSLLNAPDGSPLDWRTFSGDPASLTPAAHMQLALLARGDQTLVQVYTHIDGASDPAREIIRDLRALNIAGVRQEVGGSTATSLDTVDAIRDAAPKAVLFVIVGSYLILLLSFGSLVLPLKAILMTLLSIGASLGALVLVFQDGYLANLLGFTADGTIITTTPILMFCILFGLSMDYEVLLLSRIQEEYQRSGHNTAAVVAGVERTARVITGAAAIMVVVFGAFMAADIVIIKSFGFGLALAVLIDATIVRGLLVPATMRLLGRWNWWAPSPIRVVVRRLGLAHG